MEISDACHLAMAGHGLEEPVACSMTQQQQQQERKLKPHPDQALKCPRCASTNTKFCYYNNYSLSQPRYFCKGCRRYWTQGGTLRNVPVGGGCRKTKRSSSSSSNSKNKSQDRDLVTTHSTTPLLPALTTTTLPYDPTDFTLAFAGPPKQPPIKQFALDDGTNHGFLLGDINTDPIMPSAPTQTTGFLDFLRNGFVDITTPNSFDNLYCGFEANGSLEMATGMLSDATASTTTSQESCKAIDGNMDSERDSWFNGSTVGSSWQGLINSSLL